MINLNWEVNQSQKGFFVYQLQPLTLYIVYILGTILYIFIEQMVGQRAEGVDYKKRVSRYIYNIYTVVYVYI